MFTTAMGKKWVWFLHVLNKSSASLMQQNYGRPIIEDNNEQPAGYIYVNIFRYATVLKYLQKTCNKNM